MSLPLAQPLYDMHCHLGFAEDPASLAEALGARGVGCWSQTVTPQEYEYLSGLLGCSAWRDSGECARVPSALPPLRLGVGLHPWWVPTDACECRRQLERMEPLVGAVRWIGEVGLDFARRGIASLEAQEQAFQSVASWCVRSGGKTLSIHAVGRGAAGRTLDLLQGAGFFADGSNRAVFHWFSGSSDELVRARDAGCYFSVGPRMLQTKRGRAYASQIPESRLLLETDLPPLADGAAATVQAAMGLPDSVDLRMPQWSVERSAAFRGEPSEVASTCASETEADTMAAALVEALAALSAIRGAEPSELARIIGETSRVVLDC
ncbi:TatD family hydrolase [Adlercreutzia aquisgranensis]|uniref:TatD family hydrolase n=1 Tax=Adlercreutzia aquisgranensis TaxID=2941323 RepID=UPI0020415FDE|nr:TatD family hydrolase [Adlercreutzia aquisgranensis]